LGGKNNAHYAVDKKKNMNT